MMYGVMNLKEYKDWLYNDAFSIEDADNLIYSMIREARESELEIVALRYLLSVCMKDEFEKECMRSDILSNTTPEFTDSPEYEKYVIQYLGGKDPFKTRTFSRRMYRLAHGYIDKYHPAVCLGGLSDYLKTVNGHIEENN